MRQLLTPDNAAQLSPVSHVRVGWITDVAWSPDGQNIAIAGGTQVRVWVRTFGAAPTFVLEGHDAPVKAIAFSRDNDLLGAVGSDGQAIVWLLESPPRRVHNFSVPDSLHSVTFSSDARRLVAGSGRGEVWAWDLRTGNLSQLPYPHGGEVSAIAWRMGNVFTSGHDGELVCRDMADLRSAPTVIAAQSEEIIDFALQTDNRIAYTVSRDGTLRGWTRDGNMSFLARAHDGGADCASLHHSNHLLATGGRDGLVRLWNVGEVRTLGDSPTPVAVLTGHTKPVLALAFNPHGTLLLTGSGDNTAKLWSVEERNNGGN